MTAVPARVAGVPRDRRRVPAARTPWSWPRPSRPASTRLFRIGGAHAIAALAYGTAARAARGQDRRARATGTWPPRRRSSRADCPIDFEAGPTEIVWADDRRRPSGSPATSSRRPSTIPTRARSSSRRRRARPQAVAREVARLCPPTGPAAAALARNGAALVARSRERGDRARQPHRARTPGDRRRVTLAQRRAPAPSSSGRGRVPAAGDYATGSNHVLPTAGAARFRGGLSAADFVRVVSVQRVDARRAARRSADGRRHGRASRA